MTEYRSSDELKELLNDFSPVGAFLSLTSSHTLSQLTVAAKLTAVCDEASRKMISLSFLRISRKT